MGTLVIDVADARKNQMVWRGMGVKEVNGGRGVLADLREYDLDMSKLGDERLAMIREYAAKFSREDTGYSSPARDQNRSSGA